MNKFTRKAAFTLVALIAAVGVVSIPTSSEADSGWGWRRTTSHSAVQAADLIR